MCNHYAGTKVTFLLFNIRNKSINQSKGFFLYLFRIQFIIFNNNGTYFRMDLSNKKSCLGKFFVSTSPELILFYHHHNDLIIIWIIVNLKYFCHSHHNCYVESRN